jgi:hypothetical protein
MSSGLRRLFRRRDSGSESLAHVRVRDITRDITYVEEHTAHPGNYSFVYKGFYGDEVASIRTLALVARRSPN